MCSVVVQTDTRILEEVYKQYFWQDNKLHEYKKIMKGCNRLEYTDMQNKCYEKLIEKHNTECWEDNNYCA